MNEAGWEIATHGLKSIDYRDTLPEVEARHIAEAVRIHTEVAGARPLGFYQGRTSVNTIRLGMEEGGFLYCANSYADDLPYWLEGPRGPQLIIPYTLNSNDMRFATAQGFNTGDQFYAYLKDALDTAATPRATSRRRCCRSACTAAWSGGPGRAASLARFIDAFKSRDRVWLSDAARSRAPLDPRNTSRRAAGSHRGSRARCSSSVSSGIYEHSPWIAAAAYDAGLTPGSDTADGLAKAIAAAAAKGTAEAEAST